MTFISLRVALVGAAAGGCAIRQGLALWLGPHEVSAACHHALNAPFSSTLHSPCSHVQSPPPPPPPPPHPRAIPVVCRVNLALSSVHSRAALSALPVDTQPAASERTVHYGAGALVGELDFFLQRPRRQETRGHGLAWVGGRLCCLLSHMGCSWMQSRASHRWPLGPPSCQVLPFPIMLFADFVCSFSAEVEAAGSAWHLTRPAFESMASQVGREAASVCPPSQAGLTLHSLAHSR